MNISEKLEKVFAPLDVVEIERKYEYICPKKGDIDLPSGFLEEAKVYLGTGEYPSRNPTCWWIFKGEEHDIDSEKWEKGVANFYRLVTDPEISELDNDNYYIKMYAKFAIIAVNAKDLPETAFEEVECAIIKTSFGEFPLLEESETK